MPTEPTPTATDPDLAQATTESGDLGVAGSGGLDPSPQTALEDITDPEILRAQILRERARHSGEAKRVSDLQKQLETERATRYQAEGRLQQSLQQPAAQQVTGPQQISTTSPAAILSAEEAQRLSDAQISGDWKTVATIEELKANRILARSQQQNIDTLTTLGQQAQLQQEGINALNSYLRSQGIVDMNGPVAQLANQKLQKMANDPNYRYLGGNQLAAYAVAINEARAELGAKETALRTRGDTHEFTESSDTPSAGTPGNTTPKHFNPIVHLTPQERSFQDEAVQAGRYKDRAAAYKAAWDALEKRHPGIQKARLDSGRALTTKQFKMGGGR